jgi:DNA-binding MarR family transcriptional regulator
MTTSPPSSLPLPGDSFLLFLRRIVGAYLWRLRQWNLPEHTAAVLLYAFDTLDSAPDLPGIEPAQLADALHAPRQTISSTLNLLESRGLALRTAHASDRRRKLVTLSPAGRRIARRIRDDILAAEKAALAVLPANRLGEIRSWLASFTAELEKLNRTAPPAAPEPR